MECAQLDFKDGAIAIIETLLANIGSCDILHHFNQNCLSILQTFVRLFWPSFRICGKVICSHTLERSEITCLRIDHGLMLTPEFTWIQFSFLNDMTCQKSSAIDSNFQIQ